MGKQQGECQTVDKCGCTKTDHSDKETIMKSGTRDKAEGAFHELKGTIKEAAGKLSDNPKLQVEGTVEKLSGKVQEKIGQVKQVFGR
jgi:uncharacterized protein YjbJ (UPF0337 family)